MKYLVSLLILACCGSACAAKPQSIVGKWHFPGESCEAAITIKPMELVSEDVHCVFQSVKRQNRTVIWKGACDDAEGGSVETVIATEANGKLTIRYQNGGNVLENLERCVP